MYTGLSLVICIVWRHSLLDTIRCFFINLIDNRSQEYLPWTASDPLFVCVQDDGFLDMSKYPTSKSASQSPHHSPGASRQNSYENQNLSRKNNFLLFNIHNLTLINTFWSLNIRKKKGFFGVEVFFVGGK